MTNRSDRKSERQEGSGENSGRKAKRAARPGRNGDGLPGPEETTPIQPPGGKRSKKQPPPPTESPTPEPDDSPAIEVMPASDLRATRTEWLWRDRLEWSSVAILQGAKGAGKSTWLRTIAADVTGGPRLPGERGKVRTAGNVLWFAGEEPRDSIVHPGLAAAGADLQRVFTADTLGDPATLLLLPTGCDRLARLIRCRGVVLVIIDPLFSFLDGTVDVEGSTVQARQFTASLMRVAKSTGALILYSRNLVKDTSRGALESGRGSGELGNAARSVLHCHGLPHTPGSYGLAVASCNSGRQSPTLTYSILDRAGCGVIEVEGECSLTADELCGGDDADLERSNLEQAKALIRSMLPTGEMPSKSIRERADAAMITTRTLQLAAQRLGIRHRREGRREQTIVYWLAPSRGYPK